MVESAGGEAEFNCFGCAPMNSIGLRLVFEDRGDSIAADVTLGREYESFPGVVHGGIVATILDEVLSQAVYRSGQISVFTTGLRVRYGRPMETGMAHVAYAEITKHDETTVRAAGRIELPDGSLVAAGDGVFYLLTEEVLDQSVLDERLTSLGTTLRPSNRLEIERTRPI